MNVNQVAERLGASAPFVNNLLLSGKLKGTKAAKTPEGRMKIWDVTEQDLTAYLLTRKTKPGKKKATTKAAPKSPASNGHNREPQIRRVIDDWIDGLAARVVGLGDLTRNDIQDLARRVRRVV